MRYWWVNQNATFRQEVAGGYLWSPQRKADNSRNPFYEFMREVAPGDLVFSFADTLIKAVGIAQSYCYECPKPVEFGTKGMYWDDVGWRVDVKFLEQATRVRPKDHIETIRPLLPAVYSPLQTTGDGKQGVYLTEIPRPLALALSELLGRAVLELARAGVISDSDDLEIASSIRPPAIEWEKELVRRIDTDPGIAETEKAALILARRGQGLYKANVRKLEHECRVTKVDRIEHLRASHCKPWRDSDNAERLDAENGLLLTPSIDHLFDRGFISFENNGRLLVSAVAHKESLRRMGVSTEEAINVGAFSQGQRGYLEFHREHVFLSSTAKQRKGGIA